MNERTYINETIKCRYQSYKDYAEPVVKSHRTGTFGRHFWSSIPPFSIAHRSLVSSPSRKEPNFPCKHEYEMIMTRELEVTRLSRQIRLKKQKAKISHFRAIM